MREWIKSFEGCIEYKMFFVVVMLHCYLHVLLVARVVVTVQNHWRLSIKLKPMEKFTKLEKIYPFWSDYVWNDQKQNAEIVHTSLKYSIFSFLKNVLKKLWVQQSGEHQIVIKIQESGTKIGQLSASDWSIQLKSAWKQLSRLRVLILRHNLLIDI